MDNSLYTPFMQGSKDIIKQMSGLEIGFKEEMTEGEQELLSLGVTSIITFTGKRGGRFLIDMEPELALHITEAITGARFDSAKEYDVLTTISELNNIIAGDAITKLNNDYGLELRLAPPIVLAGKTPIISIPKLRSVTIDGNTSYGDIKINIAFMGED